MKITRRSVLTAIGSAAALSMPAIHRARAEDAVLNVYNWADYIGETTIEDFQSATGIAVTYDTYSSSEEMQAKMLAGSTGYDVVLMSTLGSPAIPIGHLTEDIGQFTERLFAFMPNTQAFNNTGQPAMSVPLAWSQAGLPIGMQFVGPMAGEARLFQLAGQLEAARPWFDRVPKL